jgi:uncharacterized membrane protein (UPF0136 family)
MKPAEPISGLWWLVPFFLAWIGGLIAYFVLKDRNEKTAEHMLIFGVVWTFVGALVISLVFFILFAVTVVRFSPGFVPVILIFNQVTRARAPSGPNPSVRVKRPSLSR